MGRFSMLEKAINNSRKINEADLKGNIEPIHNWSPNNVRRLIIGFDFALIQLHLSTSGQNKISQVQLHRGIVEDMQVIQETPEKYKPILKVLTSGRVCSCIEEIIFCIDGYPEDILRLDADINLITSKNMNGDGVSSRFPRLIHVSQVNSKVELFASLIKQTEKSTETLYKIINKAKIVKKTDIFHEEDWWHSSSKRSLRYKYYTLDNKLADLFDGVSKKFEDELHNKKILESKANILKKSVDSNYDSVNALASKIYDICNRGNNIFNNATTVDRFQWAKFLSNLYISNSIASKMPVGSEMRKAYISLDMLGILESLDNLGKDKSNIFYVSKLISESLKLSEAGKSLDLEIFKKILSTLLIHLNNIVYLSLVSYALKTSSKDKYMSFHLSKLNNLDNLTYNMAIIEFCNKRSPYGVAKRCLGLIPGSVELKVEDYGIKGIVEMSDKILSALDLFVSQSK